MNILRAMDALGGRDLKDFPSFKEGRHWIGDGCDGQHGRKLASNSLNDAQKDGFLGILEKSEECALIGADFHSAAALDLITIGKAMFESIQQLEEDLRKFRRFIQYIDDPWMLTGIYGLTREFTCLFCHWNVQTNFERPENASHAEYCQWQKAREEKEQED